jgi:hypothetical protein
VYFFNLTVPVLLASLAFTNKDAPYTAQGAFCALPSKPIWYRLGLSWIPRYIIALTVSGLAIIVYVHVELRFRAFSAASKRASLMSLSAAGHGIEGEKGEQIQQQQDSDKGRRASLPVLRVPKYDEYLAGPVDALGIQEEPYINAPQGEYLDVQQQGGAGEYYHPAQASRKQSTCTTSTTPTSASNKSGRSSKVPLGLSIKPPHPSKTLPIVASALDGPSLDVTLELNNNATRKQLRRQLRLIFIYPIVYVVLWIPPLILNIMTFFPKYNMKLPSGLAITSTVCLTIMGGVDCIVFLWREKPWRRGAGSVIGAVRRGSSTTNCCGLKRHGKGGEGETAGKTGQGRGSEGDMEAARPAANPNRQSTAHPQLDIPLSPGTPMSPIPSASSARKPSKIETLNSFAASNSSRRSRMHIRNSSSESESLAKMRAYERLALEQRDRGEGAAESVDGRRSDEIGRNASVITTGTAITSVTASSSVGQKEWWERRGSIIPIL